MKKSILAVVSLLCLCMLVSVTYAGDREVRLDGVIAAVGDHGIVLTTTHGDVRIHVDAHTRIMRNDEPARLHQLQAGDKAMVHAAVIRRGHQRHLLALGIKAYGR